MIETVLIVDVAKCEWVSERNVSPISGNILALLIVDHGVMSELVTSEVSLYTSGYCDGGVCGEYVDTVEQCMGTAVSSEPQHIVSPLV